VREAPLLVLLVASVSVPSPSAQPALITNQSVVEGLATPLDTDDEMAVFRAVFATLDDEVVVHPTENYFYFRLWAGGRAITGSLALSIRHRDAGTLSFGYRTRDAGVEPGTWSAGGGALLTERDGVGVRRVSDLVYDVSFEGRTVRFRLNPTELAPPGEVPLAAGETYVGPVLDESGLAFHLLYDPARPGLFLVLDDRRPVPERFGRLRPRLAVGERTGFAFWEEGEPGRRLLVGVAGEHVLANDWLDGPFDQMPDNAVGHGRIPAWRHYLEASYPAVRGRIDEYGYYLDEEGTRVAVAPYLVYFDRRGLVRSVSACERSAGDKRALRACLTRQVFDLPPPSRASTPRKEDPS